MHHQRKQPPCQERWAASRLTGCGGTLVLTGPGCSVRPGRENVAAIKCMIVLNTPASVPGPPQRTWQLRGLEQPQRMQSNQLSALPAVGHGQCNGVPCALPKVPQNGEMRDAGEGNQRTIRRGPGGLLGPGQLRTRPQTVALGPRSAHSPQRAGLPPPGFGLFEENQPNCNK